MCWTARHLGQFRKIGGGCEGESELLWRFPDSGEGIVAAHSSPREAGIDVQPALVDTVRAGSGAAAVHRHAHGTALRLAGLVGAARPNGGNGLVPPAASGIPRDRAGHG